MTLPASGPMTAAMINVELGRADIAPFDMNGAAERALAGVPSGAISMSNFYGKSNSPSTTHTLTCGQDGDSIGFNANIGSISPNTNLNGKVITQLYAATGAQYTYLWMSGPGPREQFVKMTINGVELLQANANYNDFGSLLWSWPVHPGLYNGLVCEVKFTY